MTHTVSNLLILLYVISFASLINTKEPSWEDRETDGGRESKATDTAVSLHRVTTPDTGLSAKAIVPANTPTMSPGGEITSG